MAVDIFMKLDPLKGESKDAKHKDEIDVISWSWGLTQAATWHSGSGGGAGKVSVHDLNFTHHVDTASTDLMKACATGKHLAKGVLTVRKAGEHPLEFLKITLEDILVTGVQTGGSGHDEVYTENVTLNFAKFKVEYTPQTEKGAGGVTTEVKWNIAANSEN